MDQVVLLYLTLPIAVCVIDTNNHIEEADHMKEVFRYLNIKFYNQIVPIEFRVLSSDSPRTKVIVGYQKCLLGKVGI